MPLCCGLFGVDFFKAEVTVLGMQVTICTLVNMSAGLYPLGLATMTFVRCVRVNGPRVLYSLLPFALFLANVLALKLSGVLDGHPVLSMLSLGFCYEIFTTRFVVRSMVGGAPDPRQDAVALAALSLATVAAASVPALARPALRACLLYLFAQYAHAVCRCVTRASRCLKVPVLAPFVNRRE